MSRAVAKAVAVAGRENDRIAERVGHSCCLSNSDAGQRSALAWAEQQRCGLERGEHGKVIGCLRRIDDAAVHRRDVLGEDPVDRMTSAEGGRASLCCIAERVREAGRD